MLNALRFQQVSKPAGVHCSCELNGVEVSSRRRMTLRLPTHHCFASFTVQSAENASSEPSVSSRLTYTIGSSSAPHLSQRTIINRHILSPSFFACTAAISAACLFWSAIPALLSLEVWRCGYECICGSICGIVSMYAIWETFKRAAESLEKLMDATREELPDAMAAVRLSGTEISDLMMELSDLSQGITEGVTRSTRAVRSAEERLRQLTNMNPIVSAQEVGPKKPQIADPVVARTARNMREGIVQCRAVLQTFFTLIRKCWIWNSWTSVKEASTIDDYYFSFVVMHVHLMPSR